MTKILTPKRKLRKPRKPKLKWFACGHYRGSPAVFHIFTEMHWTGVKRLRAIGDFFLKAADWAEAQERGK